MRSKRRHLLGGEHGPLRTLSGAVTYGALFGGGYGVPLDRRRGGLAFAAVLTTA